MKKTLTLLLLISSFISHAQTFNYSGIVPAAIPDNNTTAVFPVTVSGLPSQINMTFGIEKVCMDISHAWLSDLKVSLISQSN